MMKYFFFFNLNRDFVVAYFCITTDFKRNILKDIQRNYLSSDYLIKIERRMYFSQTFEQFKTLVQEEKKFTFSKIIILFLYANICSEKCKKRARMQHRYYTAWQRKKTRRSFLSVVSSIVSLELPFMWFLKC